MGWKGDLTMKCPKCKANITYIMTERTGTQYGSAYPSTRSLSYEDDDFDSDGNLTFRCPECQDELGMNEDEVMEAFDNKQRD